MTERVRDWPGAHAARALLDGEPLVGYWFNRSQEYAARRRGESFDRYRYATEETVELSPLPCWSHLSPEDYQKRAAELVEEGQSRWEFAKPAPWLSLRSPQGVSSLGLALP